jgi:YgiT-type zinc finger domain-containing protein
MQCTNCREGDTSPGLVTLTFDRNSTTVIYRDVPAEICPRCGERYVPPEITAAAMAHVDAALVRGTELEILRWPGEPAPDPGLEPEAVGEPEEEA